ERSREYTAFVPGGRGEKARFSRPRRSLVFDILYTNERQAQQVKWEDDSVPCRHEDGTGRMALPGGAPDSTRLRPRGCWRQPTFRMRMASATTMPSALSDTVTVRVPSLPTVTVAKV